MKNSADVVIIGAGSAGLAALRQIKKATDNVLLIDHGPLGTTCARVGCMPSKALLAVAKDLHRAAGLAAAGLSTGSNSCDIPAILAHVRRKRDLFAGGMVETTRRLAGKRLIEGTARLLGPDRVLVNGDEIRCNKIILATGSRPLIPPAWQAFADRVITADSLFEQTDLPPRLALVGLGAIGLEIGQALARLGLQVTGFGRNPHIGGLRDPEINRAAVAALQREFPLHVGSAAEPAATDNGIRVANGSQAIEVDMVIAGLSVTPNIEELGLETLGVKLDERGLPPFDPNTLQIAGLPVFLTGDANGKLALLHEAQDEGFIAGSNALAPSPRCYRRRTPLRICFSDPQIASVGLSVDRHDGLEIVTGRADFSEQSRAVAEGRNAGRLHVYVEKTTARLVGGEMAVPDGEHLAQLLALAVQQQLTVGQMLNMPFYHPTVEEGLRTALRDAAEQLAEIHSPTELSLCDSCPEPPLC
ncbi:MAG: dihydrolipoyl dehydrogenase [Syntrophotaleaceae bacterium]